MLDYGYVKNVNTCFHVTAKKSLYVGSPFSFSI